MPRWPQILLALVLFVGIMLAVRAVLYVILPPFNRWMDHAVGASTWTTVVIALAIIGGVYGFWPRDSTGRMKPLLPRRR